jgi:hypothetical protein
MLRRRNIIVAGGTNTGKTTLVNVLINEGIPDYNERLAVIEDAAELQIDARRNVIRRLANSKADMKRHVFEILRARPTASSSPKSAGRKRTTWLTLSGPGTAAVSQQCTPIQPLRPSLVSPAWPDLAARLSVRVSRRCSSLNAVRNRTGG